jgi:polyphosphate glucokinase
METLGIDIGGTGIKGAPVDTVTGALLAPRVRILTPEQGKPKPVAKVVAEIAAQFKWQGPIGCGFPSVVQNGIVFSAANVHKSWIGLDADKLFEETTKLPVRVINDADAAGLAEITFGAGRGEKGLVMIITIGTGLGSALFINGQLVPNTELGHIEIKGKDAEVNASEAARIRQKMSWKRWSSRFNTYLQTLERLFWPDLFILGGGGAKEFARFKDSLQVRARVVPAQMGNEAGIVGAAMAANLKNKTS